MKTTPFILFLSFSLSTYGVTLHRKGLKLDKKVTFRAPQLKESADLSSEKAELLAKRRMTLLNDLKKILKDSRNAEQRFELRFRLANLYLEDYRYLAGKGAKATESLEKARILYRELATENPSHPRQDELLFQLGQTSLESAKTEEAIKTFEYISEHFSGSRFIEEANIQIAEHAFDKNDFKKAELYYNKILQNTSSPLFLFATYKKGWCAYNLSRPEEAISSFKSVISENASTTSSANSLALRREALRDICLPFSELKRFSEAISFFRQQDDETYRNALESLGALALNSGEHEASISIYSELLNLDNHFHKNPEYSLALFDTFRSKGDSQKAIAEISQALDTYLGNSTWKEIFSSDVKIISSTRQRFEEATRKLGQETHLQAQKTKNRELYKTARKIYETYLQFFPFEPEALKTRFFLAEILYHEKEFSSASAAYREVYKNSPRSEDINYNSLRYAVLASYEAINQERKQAGLFEISKTTHAKLTSVGQEKEEVVPYTDSESAFLSLSHEVHEIYSKKEETPGVLYQAAYLHYVHYDHLKAYKLFWNLVQEYPRHSVSAQSAFLILDILNRQADYTNLVIAAKRLLEKPASSERAYTNELGDILRKAELKRIGALEERSLFKEAAEAYLVYTRSYGAQDENLNEKALFNASVCFSKAGRYLDAIEAQELFLRKFPRSPFRESLLLQMAKSYENQAEFGKAGFYFEKFAREFPRNTQAKEALRISGLYSWGAGETGKAENAFIFYLNSYPQDKDSVEKDLLALYAETDQPQKQIDYLLQARSEKGMPLSKYLDFTLQIIELQKTLSGKAQQVLLDEANSVALKYAKTLSETPRGLKLLAQVRLRQIEPKQRLFESTRLALPQRALELSLAKKLRLLKELETDLQQVASMGGEEALGAAYKTAVFYYELSQELLETPVPPELTAEQVDAYREELKKQMIQPFKEKALGFVIQCSEKATEYQILSSWAVLCKQLANRMDPINHFQHKTHTLAPLQIGVIPFAKDESLENSFHQSSSFFRESLKERKMASFEGGPQLISLQDLREEREETLKLKESLESPVGSESTFGYLNRLRLANPSKAVKVIKSFLQDGNLHPAYTNLLALAAMESGNYSFAKTVFLSLIARGQSSPEVINNLGVLETLKGNEGSALSYFLEANQQESKEAAINLGLLALRYENGSVAENYFDSASGSLLSHIGTSIARLQKGNYKKAKEELLELQKTHPQNPWIQLSLSVLAEDTEEEIKSLAPLHFSESSELPEIE